MARISDRCVIQLVEQKIVVMDDISGVELVFPPDQHQALADRLAETAAPSTTCRPGWPNTRW